MIRFLSQENGCGRALSTQSGLLPLETKLGKHCVCSNDVVATMIHRYSLYALTNCI